MKTLFSEENSVEAVLERLDRCENPRLKQVMTALITHLHGFIKDVEPTMDEWFTAIQFLTQTGHKCDDVRQEFILLSDTLGASMLCESINNRKDGGGTEATVKGPFYAPQSPKRALGDTICEDGKGQPCWIEGRVLDTDGRPIVGASLDIWQTNGEGLYEVQEMGRSPQAISAAFLRQMRKDAIIFGQPSPFPTRSRPMAPWGIC